MKEEGEVVYSVNKIGVIFTGKKDGDKFYKWTTQFWFILSKGLLRREVEKLSYRHEEEAIDIYVKFRGLVI